MKKESIVFLVLTFFSVFVIHGASTDDNFVLHVDKYYLCNEHLKIKAREPVRLSIGRHVNHAWCTFNKHREELLTNQNNASIMIKPEAYMSGNWTCVALHDVNLSGTEMANTCYERNWFRKTSCNFCVTVEDNWETHLWLYIGIGTAALIIIIIAQTIIILLCHWRKIGRTKHLDELSLTQLRNTNEDRARYSVCPGLSGLLSKKKKTKEYEESGSIYETLEPMADGACSPPPPPIATLPREPKKSFASKVLRTGTSIPTEDDLPSTLPRKEAPKDAQMLVCVKQGRRLRGCSGARALMRNKQWVPSTPENRHQETEPESMKHVKNRPPMPLPTEATEEATAVKPTNRKEDREPLVTKESKAPPALIKPNTECHCKATIKREDPETLVEIKPQARSSSASKFIASITRKSANRESVARKKSDAKHSTINETAMSELDFILKNRREGTFSKKAKPTCSVKPEPKGPEPIQPLGVKSATKPTPNTKPILAKPNVAPQPKKVAATQPLKTMQPATHPATQPATHPATQQVKPTPLRAALPATSKQTPEATQPQTALQRRGKMPPQPQTTAEVPRGTKPLMPLPPEPVSQTEPTFLQPVDETQDEIYEEPAYEPHSSDGEWTEEELEDYHLYSI